MEVASYQEFGADAWDDLVAQSRMGTLLHTRAFLSYHRDRFMDASVTLHRDGRLVGVLSGAVDPASGDTVASHPGATFGGIVHDGSLVGQAMLDALEAVAAHYRTRGFCTLRYAPVPFIYHRQPSADDLYALFRLGGTRVRCDLSCAVDLDAGVALSSRRRRGLNKARRVGIEVAAGTELIEELWPVVEANLTQRHSATPTHTAAELALLAERFPEEVCVFVARHDFETVGGVVLFCSERVVHAQYIASTEAGNDGSALDAVFERCFSVARRRGARYFDFGTSNREGGRVLNDGLYSFKAQFGGGGVAYEFYELDLTRPASEIAR